MVFHYCLGVSFSGCLLAFFGPTDGGQNDFALVWWNTRCLDYLFIVFPVNAFGRIRVRCVIGECQAADSTGIDTPVAIGDCYCSSTHHAQQRLETNRWRLSHDENPLHVDGVCRLALFSTVSHVDADTIMVCARALRAIAVSTLYTFKHRLDSSASPLSLCRRAHVDYSRTREHMVGWVHPIRNWVLFSRVSIVASTRR